jgi:hypothetical protein
MAARKEFGSWNRTGGRTVYQECAVHGGTYGSGGNQITRTYRRGSRVAPCSARTRHHADPLLNEEATTMAGRIREMIDTIIGHRAKDNPMLAGVIKTKLVLKGIDPNRFNRHSDDDPVIIAKLEALINDFK